MTKQRPLCPRACAVPAILFALLFCASFCAAALPLAQLAALEDLYAATDGDNWFFNFGWGSGDPCDDGWFGVTCNAGGTTVLELDFEENDLVGTIPESIGDLVDLTSFNVYDNFIDDPIPEALGTLANLKDLNLGDNYFDSLPASMSGLTSLETLNLSFNPFSGALPEVLGQITSLILLDLSENSHRGEFPGPLRTLTNLQILRLYDNSFDTVSPDLALLTSLKELDIEFNSFSGSFPGGLEVASTLEILNVNDNSYDSINVSPGDFPLLKELDIEYNSITGSFPGGLEVFTTLEKLDASDNQFDSINVSPGDFPLLKELDIEYNSITGPFPGGLEVFTTLEKLDASDNEFDIVTSDVGVFTAMTNLDIEYNSITSLPIEIWGLNKLIEFDASNNDIEGVIPSSISNIVNLFCLDLYGNSFSGPLPDAFTNLVNLNFLDLADNHFTGSVPESLKFLTKLDYLDLADNMFSGKLPPSLGNLPLLTYLSLSNNNLSGVVPESFSNLVSLYSFYLENNNFFGLFPASLATRPSSPPLRFPFRMDARNNRFTCPLPTWCDNISGDGSCGTCIVCSDPGNGGDIDRDNVCGVDDNCPRFANPQQLDSDAPACDGSGEGDPHFIGFHHQSFDFFGLPGQIYNLLSDSALQVNTFLDRQQFGPHFFFPGPVMKIISFFTADHTVIVNAGGIFRDDLGFVSFDGVRMKDGEKIVVDDLTVSFSITSASAKDYGMKGDDQIVAICHFTLEGLFDFQLFLIENHSNPFLPNVPATSKYYRRFIDFNAALLDQERDCHGILGQTARLQPGDRERSLKDWKIEGTEQDYIVTDGLLGKDFAFNKFAV